MNGQIEKDVLKLSDDELIDEKKIVQNRKKELLFEIILLDDRIIEIKEELIKRKNEQVDKNRYYR